MIRSGLPGSGGLLRYLDWFGGGAAHAYCVLFQSSTSFITSVMTFLFPYIHTQNRGKKKRKGGVFTHRDHFPRDSQMLLFVPRRNWNSNSWNCAPQPPPLVRLFCTQPCTRIVFLSFSLPGRMQCEMYFVFISIEGLLRDWRGTGFKKVWFAMFYCY